MSVIYNVVSLIYNVVSLIYNVVSLIYNVVSLIYNVVSLIYNSILVTTLLSLRIKLSFYVMFLYNVLMLFC